jgi:UDP-N-acetylglucosamine 2-epimerase (non-hydrolysing)
MKKSHIILTDSGGVQEEAPALGVPVLVLRDETERPEALDSGCVRLAGTDSKNIVKEVDKLLEDNQHYKNMTHAINPYGDGKACIYIEEIIEKLF